MREEESTMTKEQEAHYYISVLITSFDDDLYEDYRHMIEHPEKFRFYYVDGEAIIMPYDTTEYRAHHICKMASVQVAKSKKRYPWFLNIMHNKFKVDFIGHTTLWSIAYTNAACMGKIDISYAAQYPLTCPIYQDFITPNCIRFHMNRLRQIPYFTSIRDLIKG